MDQQFCLHWNNHQSTLITVLEQLLHNERLVDVTLTAEGQSIGAHKIVLSACSPYFEEIFSLCGDKHPVIFLKDVRFNDIKCLLDYMYKGEVNVSEEQLPLLIQTAESLKIKGLADGLEDKKSNGKEKKTTRLAGLSDQNIKPENGIVEDVPSKKLKFGRKLDESFENSEFPSNNASEKSNTKSFEPSNEVLGSPLVLTDDSNDRTSTSNSENMVSEVPSDIKVPDLNCAKIQQNQTIEIKSEKVEEDDIELEEDMKKEGSEGDNSSYLHWNSSLDNFPNSQYQDTSEGSQGLSCEFSKNTNPFVDRWICHKCQRTYKYKRTLRRHLHLECGVAPKFHCPTCLSTFKRKENLREHSRRFHGEEI